MFNKKSTTASQSRNTKIAIAAICVIILALCLVVGKSNNASAMTSVNDAQNNEVVIEAVDATTATDATETEATETTESTEATEDEEETKETIEVPVYIYVPVETEPQPTVPPTTEPKEEPEETKPYEELPEATKPEEETPEETKPEETKPAPEETKPAHVHNFSIVWTKVNPTCTANGYTLYICDGCTETEMRDFVEPIGHEYIVYKNEGYETHWCSNCGDTFQVEVEAPAPADETIPVETEPATEPVEETKPAHAGHTCDPSDGHNHKEVKMGPFTYVYCEKVTEATKSADGRIEYFPYSWCL